MAHRKKWLSIALVWIAIGIDLSGMMLGATLANGMSFNRALWAVFIGSFILGILAMGTTYVGAKTGLSTGMIAKSTFGIKGAILMATIMGISSLGWFSVQIGFFAENIHTALNQIFHLSLPIWLLAILGGILMLISAFWGYHSIERLSIWSVPLLVGLILLGVFLAFNRYGTDRLFLPVKQAPLAFGTAVSLVIGVYIVGIVVAPDIARWAVNTKQAMIAGFVGFFVGNSFMVVIALILVKLTSVADLTKIFFVLGLGMPAILVLTLAQWTTNTNNLYSATLDFAVVFPKISSKVLTLVGGFVGISLAAIGIYGYFETFLMIITVLVSPIAGIYLVDYFFNAQKYSFEAQKSMKNYQLLAFISWLVGTSFAFMTSEPPAGFGLFALTKVSALDGILIAGLCHLVLLKLLQNKSEVTLEVSEDI